MLDFACATLGQGRSLAVVDKHLEIVRRISRTVQEAGPVLRGAGDVEEILVKNVKKAISELGDLPTLFISTNPAEWGQFPASPSQPCVPPCPSSPPRPVSPPKIRISSLKLQYTDTPENSVRVHLSLEQTLPDLPTVPYYDAEICEPLATVGDLLEVVKERLGIFGTSEIRASLKVSLGSPTLFPLRTDALILEEIEDFRELGEFGSFPCIVISQ